MAFKHSCFISYRRIDSDTGQAFVKGLAKAIDDSLKLQVKKAEVFLDESTGPLTKLEPTFADAMCQSLFMVMVFTPDYFDEEEPWCAREYQAMLNLEAKRLAALPPRSEA